MLLMAVACTSTPETKGEAKPIDESNQTEETSEKTSNPKKVRLATIPNIEPHLQIAKEILVNHLKWINAFNEANGSNLVMVEPYYYYSPIRMYSKKWDSVEEFPEGAVIAVSNDPSNLEVALIMLQDVGLITLGEKSGDFYTEVDIVENPKNIQLIMAETIDVAKSIDDADAVISFAFYAVRAGGVKADDFLAENKRDKEEYPVGLIVQEGDQDAEWAKYLAENFLKDKWIEKADEFYPEGCYPYYR